MSRLIEADEAKENVCKWECGEEPDCPLNKPDAYTYEKCNSMRAIDECRTIDAVPVVHGKWVFSENDDMFYCTNCKNGSVRNDYPYCHWCGAVMDGEKEKE